MIEVPMDEVLPFYDAMAEHYHLIFQDWEASIAPPRWDHRIISRRHRPPLAPSWTVPAASAPSVWPWRNSAFRLTRLIYPLPKQPAPGKKLRPEACPFGSGWTTCAPWKRPRPDITGRYCVWTTHCLISIATRTSP